MVANAGAESPSVGFVWDQSQYFLEHPPHGVLLSLLLVWLLTLIIWTYQRKGASEYLTKDIHRERTYIKNYLPPVLPNGWIPVLESSKLKVNTVKTLNVIGLDLVAFRTEDGAVCVLDAFCSQLDAHLGLMGQVVGDCIECSLHGWKFRGKDGVCTHAPCANKTPELLNAKAWPCREVFPFIFVWHHAEGDSPSWEPPEAPASLKGPWQMAGRFERSIGAHCQDVAENTADVAHLNQIHGPSMLLTGKDFVSGGGNGWKGRWVQHSYKSSWSESGSASSTEVEIRSKVLGIELQFLTTNGYYRTSGPAFFHSCFSVGKWRFYTLLSMTPTGLFKVDLVHYLFTEPGFPWILAKLIHYGFCNEVDRDIVMWHKKGYHQKPALVEEDKAIPAFRRWYSQFYSASSPTWKDIKNKTFEW